MFNEANSAVHKIQLDCILSPYIKENSHAAKDRHLSLYCDHVRTCVLHYLGEDSI